MLPWKAFGDESGCLACPRGYPSPSREGHKALTFYPAAKAAPGCTTRAPLGDSAKKGAVNRLQEAQGWELPHITYCLELGRKGHFSSLLAHPSHRCWAVMWDLMGRGAKSGVGAVVWSVPGVAMGSAG